MESQDDDHQDYVFGLLMPDTGPQNFGVTKYCVVIHGIWIWKQFVSNMLYHVAYIAIAICLSVSVSIEETDRKEEVWKQPT